MDPLLLGFFKDGMGIAQSASARDALPGLEAQYESKCESEQARCVRARDAAGSGEQHGGGAAPWRPACARGLPSCRRAHAVLAWRRRRGWAERVDRAAWRIPTGKSPAWPPARPPRCPPQNPAAVHVPCSLNSATVSQEGPATCQICSGSTCAPLQPAASECVSVFLDSSECQAQAGEYTASDVASVGVCRFAANRTMCYKGAELCSSNQDLCSLFDLCYDGSKEEEECTPAEGADYPVWISTSMNRSGLAAQNQAVQGVLQYYNGSGFCLLGAVSKWSSAAVFGKPECEEGDGGLAVYARSFQAAGWGTDEATCAARTCSQQVRFDVVG